MPPLLAEPCLPARAALRRPWESANLSGPGASPCLCGYLLWYHVPTDSDLHPPGAGDRVAGALELASPGPCSPGAMSAEGSLTASYSQLSHPWQREDGAYTGQGWWEAACCRVWLPRLPGAPATWDILAGRRRTRAGAFCAVPGRVSQRPEHERGAWLVRAHTLIIGGDV